MSIWRWVMKLGLNVTDLQVGAKKAETAFVGIGRTARKHVGGELRGIGAAFAGMFTLSAARQAIMGLERMNGEIHDMADGLGTSLETAQKFQAAVAKGPLGMSGVMSAINKMEAKRTEALAGDANAQGLFKTLGVDFREGDSVSLLDRVVGAAGAGPAQRDAAITLTTKKLNLLTETMAELHNLGPIVLITDDQSRRIDDASKALKEAGDNLIKTAAPALVAMMDALAKLAPSTVAQNFGMALRQIEKANLKRFGFGGIADSMDLSAGGVSTDALPLPDRSKATTTAQAVEAAAAVAAENKTNDITRRSQAGGLASSGGFFFDAPRRDHQESVRHLRDIAMATKKTAEVITREVE
jgi:hypothetical protein